MTASPIPPVVTARALRRSGYACERCGARAGWWCTRLRKLPQVESNVICISPNDPGAGWWKVVTDWWKVDDGPKPSDWTPPEKIVLTVVEAKDREASPDGTRVLCRLCAPPVQPALFDTDGDQL